MKINWKTTSQKRKDKYLQRKEQEDKIKGELLHQLLFKDKVEKLGNLDVKHHPDGYALINASKE
jgi:hypothetical protein